MRGPDYSSDDNRSQATPSWAGLLVFSCLATRLMAAMLKVEESRFSSEREQSRLTETSYGIAEARQEDLGKNLADIRTQMIHLDSPRLNLAGSMAFNEPLRWGALFCDRMPVMDSGIPCEIWAIAADGGATELAGFEPLPGVSVYQFEWGDDVPTVRRIEITAGNRAQGADVIFAGSIQ